MYIVKQDGRRWKVREAKSLRDAMYEITHARVLGSIGSRSEEIAADGSISVVADVHEINPDGTERQPN